MRTTLSLLTLLGLFMTNSAFASDLAAGKSMVVCACSENILNQVLTKRQFDVPNSGNLRTENDTCLFLADSQEYVAFSGDRTVTTIKEPFKVSSLSLAPKKACVLVTKQEAKR